jgi:hypothetical protein
MYYTKDGKPTLYPQTEKDRFAAFIRKLRDRRQGISEPTEEELEQIYGKRCRYWRAARASRA